jgi:hypothetical protein
MQATVAEFPERSIDVIDHNDDGLTAEAIPTMAGQTKLTSVAPERAKRRIGQVVVAIHPDEIEDSGIKRERGPHVGAAHKRDNSHLASADLLRVRTLAA